MATTYTKLRDGSWGVRAPAGTKAGDLISVTKRDGSTKPERVERVLWQGDGVALCSIAPSAPPASSGGSRYYARSSGSGSGRRKACVSDGNCSSFGNGRSCGGYDCDGY